MEELSNGKPSGKLNVPTRRQIAEAQEDDADRILQKYFEENELKQDDVELDPRFDGVNINRQKAIEESKLLEEGGKLVDVTGVDEALKTLSVDEIDLHPEKRVKAVNFHFYIRLGIFI